MTGAAGPPVPDPPASSDLGDFPRHVLTPDDVLYRIHRFRRSPTFYGNDQSGRFDPPPGVVAFGTCYTASSEEACFVETFARERYGGLERRPIPLSTVLERALSVLTPATDIAFADFSNRMIVGRFKLTAAASTGGDLMTYEACQRWAGALWEAGFGGVRYWARHDTALRSMSYAVFGGPGESATPLTVVAQTPLSIPKMSELAREFGFVVTDDSVF